MAKKQTMPKGFKEAFAKFFENPTREGLRELLKENVGELDQLDFKESWDCLKKLPRHVLALANSGGGCIVVGVKECKDKSLEAVGLSALLDKAKFHDAMKAFVPDDLQCNVIDFSFKETEYAAIKGKAFQVILVESDPKALPYICAKTGEHIEEGAIYVRRGTQSVKAGKTQMEKLISARLETGYSSAPKLELAQHLEQLELLYQQVPRRRAGGQLAWLSHGGSLAAFSALLSEPNPDYPKEGYEQFILKLIEEKKVIVRKVLRLQ